MKVLKWGCATALAFWGGMFGLAMVVAVAGVSATASGQHGGGPPTPLPPGISFIWPVQGAITAGFGIRDNPTHPGSEEQHWGIDIAADEGIPVKAATPGRVHLAGVAGNYGNLVIVISPGGEVVTWYGHLSGFTVQRGDEVAQGDVIGYTGSTGRSTGPHLHFEIRPRGGTPVDPLPLLERPSVDSQGG